MTASTYRSAADKLSTRHRSARKLLLEGLEPRLALAITGLGVAGDSWSDEYAEDYLSSGSPYSQNWVELLRSQRGINVGPNMTAPYQDPQKPEGQPPTYDPWEGIEYRRTGAQFNFAYKDSRVIDLLTQGFGQDFNVRELYENGQISHAVLMIGNSDFDPSGQTFANIADATVWSDQQVEAEMAVIAQFIDTAMQTMAKAPIKFVVTTIPDPTLTPAGRALSTPAGRARVTAAVASVNASIRASAATYHFPVVDLASLATTVLGTPSNLATQRTIGGNVYTVQGGIPKTNLFIQGGELPHTVFNALVANAIIEGFNVAYNDNIPKFTEQQIVTLAGQSYGGTDTFPINYASLVTVPPVTVYIDFGQTSTLSDSFIERINEKTSALQIPNLQTGAPGATTEFTNLKAAIKANLEAAFAGTTVNFSLERFSTQEVQPDSRFEVIKLGRLSGSDPGPLTSLLGHGSFDWLNANETSNGFVYPDLIPDLIGATKLKDLPRSEQLRYLTNILSYYIIQEVGRGFGLSASDAYAYPAINNTTYTNTNGVQFNDYMSGDPALGFNTNVFNGTPAFTFSPLAKAKLQYGRWVTNPNLVSISETASAHDNAANAQIVALGNSSTTTLKIANIKGASIASGGQKDMYRVTLAAGDKITAQTFATGVYGAPIDTIVKLYAPDGSTLLATSDNTLLGNNTFGQAGSTLADTDSLLLNFTVPSAGNYLIEVTAAGAPASGNYDLLIGNTVTNNFPWQNQSNPLNVNNSLPSAGPLVTAFDALLVINELNNPQIMNPVTFALPTPSGSVAPPPFLDVNGSNTCTAFDALLVINFLNENPITGPESLDTAGEASFLSAGESADDSSPAADQSQGGGFVGAPAPLGANSNAPAGDDLNLNYFGAAGDLAPLWLLTSQTPAGSAGEAPEGCTHETNDQAVADLFPEDE